jgi:hypothetical protein
MEIDDVFEFFHDVFTPAYVDLVTYIVKRPEQISFELEAVLSHLVQSYNKNINDTKKNENIVKAMGHLERATLDSYKLLWVESFKSIKTIENLGFFRKFFLNTPEYDFLVGVQKVRELARAARTKEMASMGIEPHASIDLYKELAKRSLQVAGSLDKHKTGAFKKITRPTLIKTFFLQNIIGLITGFLSSGLLWILTNQ